MPSTQTSSTAAMTAEMKVFGRGRLSDLFGDMVIYRDLQPLDSRLPKTKIALRELGLSSDHMPRKQDPDYAKIAIWYGNKAQEKRNASKPLQELLFIGDSLYNDGRAFVNMRLAANWDGSCFIGVEVPDDEAAVCIGDDFIYAANRWASIGDWIKWMIDEQGLKLDEGTLVVVDIDKCILGARGRNDTVIDQARIQGAYRTMNNLLGSNFDGTQFEQHYNELNQPKYHCLTEDNQDYLAYIGLVLNAGLISFDEIIAEIANGNLENFSQFTRLVEMRMMITPGSYESLRESHDAVITSVRNGDPTPFKRFRRQEFVATTSRLGNMADGSTVEELLAEEITLTQEVWEVAEWLKNRGCLLVCLSDKPSEASCPHRYVSPDLPAIHDAETHRVGTSIQPMLDSLD